MSLNTIRQNIFTYINDNFTIATIVFDGSNAGDNLAKGRNPWIFTSIVWGDEMQRSMGIPNAHFGRHGILSIRLYTLMSNGVGEVDSISDDLFDLLRSTQTDNVTFSPGRVDSDTTFQNKWKVRFLHFPFIALSQYQII